MLSKRRMDTNRHSRALVGTIAALVIWTVLSYALISMFSGSHVCALVNPHQPTPMSQAEMDAITAGCNRPNIGTILAAVAGYFVILVAGAMSMIARPEVSPPSRDS